MSRPTTSVATQIDTTETGANTVTPTSGASSGQVQAISAQDSVKDAGRVHVGGVMMRF